ncbi:hypothetical protein Tco_0864508 [Tanacetum coccineum]
MKDVFMKYGHVFDLYIAVRRNKLGKRFLSLKIVTHDSLTALIGRIDVLFNGYVFDSSDDDDDDNDTFSASDVGSANEVEHSTNEEGEDSGKGSDAESDNDIGQENTNNSNGTFNIDGLGWSFHPCYAADSLSKERSSSIPGQFPRTNPRVDVPDKLCYPQKDKSTTNNLLSSTYVKSTTKCLKSTLHPYGPSLNSSINPTQSPTQPRSPNKPIQTPTNTITSHNDQHTRKHISKNSSVPPSSSQRLHRQPHLRKKRFASLKLFHPLNIIAPSLPKRNNSTTKPKCSIPSKTTSVSISNPIENSDSLSKINGCNFRILKNHNSPSNSKQLFESILNEVEETINEGINLGFDMIGKDNDIAIIVGSGSWQGVDIPCLFVVVYAPQDKEVNKNFGTTSKKIIALHDTLSIIMGDFNEIRAHRSSTRW